MSGVKRVNAPGYVTDVIPGITQTGQYWMIRFANYCNKLVGEMEEEWKIYKIVRKHVGKGLQFEMCFNGKHTDCINHPTKAPAQNIVKTEL